MVDKLHMVVIKTIFCVQCQTLSSVMLRDSKLIFCSGFFILALLGSGGLHAQSMETNTRWVIREVMPQIDSLLQIKQAKVFHLEMNAPELVLSLLKSELIQRGYSLIDDPSPELMAKKLTIDPVLFLSFQKRSKNEAIRELRANLSIQLSDPKGVIEFSEWIEHSASQVIVNNYQSYQDDLWEMSRFKEVKSRKKSDQFRRVMEPVLILSTIAITVFLLFNVRTQ